MNTRPLRILQVNTCDIAGGAEKVSWDLHHEYRRRGHTAGLAVGRKRSSDPDVFLMPHDQPGRAWSRAWWRAHVRLQPYYTRSCLARWLCRATHALAEPRGVIERFLGREDFNYPGTWRLLDRRPHIIHCHNLHGKYFDLRALGPLSRRVPVFLTLHDEWLFTGHCAHSFNCARWLTGCGDCPALDAFPPVRRDATAGNWRRKRDIYTGANLYVAAPSRWLLDRAARSILAPAIVERRVIHNGVDLATFRPADRAAARTSLGLPADAAVLLFVANKIRQNPYKDYATLRNTLTRLNPPAGRRIVLVGLGEEAKAEQVGPVEVRFVPFQPEPAAVVRYYQAADVYVHAARVDTFPSTVIEALACGTPVVATAVGGIPEQVTSLDATGNQTAANHAAAANPAGDAARPPTGILVPPGDSAAFAAAIERLLASPALCRQLSQNGVADARQRFDLRRQADAYLSWYMEALEGRGDRTVAQARRRLVPEAAGAPAG